MFENPLDLVLAAARFYESQGRYPTREELTAVDMSLKRDVDAYLRFVTAIWEHQVKTD